MIKKNKSKKNDEPKNKLGYILKRYRLGPPRQSVEQMAESIGIGVKAYLDLEAEKDVLGVTLAAVIRWLLAPWNTQIYDS